MQPITPKVASTAKPVPVAASEAASRPTQEPLQSPSLSDKQVAWLAGGIAGVFILAAGIGWLVVPSRRNRAMRCRSDSMQTVQFDPYHVWLGIPAQEQPAHHYRLLGIALFEGQADVIATAADRQMGHLRTFQSAQHSPLSQRLLNEVATAKICLLNSAKKAAYDEQLRRRLQPRPPPDAPPVWADIAEGL